MSIQLDRGIRSELEGAVLSIRSAAEADLRYQLTDRFGLDAPEEVPTGLSEEEAAQREALKEAIGREAVDGHDWPEAVELYVEGLGYTVVNRLAALRCMEARGFIDRPVTRFREDGRTPAADPLIEEEFYTPEEAPLEAYRRACEQLAEDVELLFDPDSVYSRLEPRPSAFRDLCHTVDEVPEEAWRADDVLGWVYQYYHIDDLDDLRRKADRQGLDPEDVAPANQFYTPHWVVRMLTDNSLGKLYLEHTGELEEAEKAQESLTPEERKHRSLNPGETPTVVDLCTYLVPGSEAGASTEWSDPSELRVIDPACGSGHFLLYAFDVLERIWWAERPDVPRSEVPARILEHNLYGVDLDLRACQLAAFNLYLKGRRRAETEGAESFELPPMNIVCADARVAEIAEAEEVFEELAPEGSREREALEDLLETFHGSHGLGSLLDVKGTLRDELLEKQRDVFAAWDSPKELLQGLSEAVERRRKNGSFLVRDLKSFLRLLEVLAGSYDVALMNPPYGSRGRMPDLVKSYVKERYEYSPEFYINFFEVCERLLRPHGRVGMLVPRTFMFNRTYRAFREDFVGERGTFDFLAEYGLGVLDNATVRTAGTVVRTGTRQDDDEDREGLFLRLHDKATDEKEPAFVRAICGQEVDERGIQRVYRRRPSEFEMIRGVPLSYWVPLDLRELYDSPVVLDADNAGLDRTSVGSVKVGLQTGNDGRFFRYFWEVDGDYQRWKPLAKGGEDAFVLPRITLVVFWEESGKELKRYSGSVIRNEHYYFREGITYNRVKEGGRRFGYLNPKTVFSDKGSAILPDGGDVWPIIGYLNSQIVTYLMLGQTPERMWEISMVSKLPWDEGLREEGKLRELSRHMVGQVVGGRRADGASPYFDGPWILQLLDEGEALHSSDHPHRAAVERGKLPLQSVPSADRSAPLSRLAESVGEYRTDVQESLAGSAAEVDGAVLDHFGVGADGREQIMREIGLRTPQKSPEERGGENGSSQANVTRLVVDLIHYLAVEAAKKDADGVVPLGSVSDDEESGLFSRVQDRVAGIWDEHAEERLREADQALGDRVPAGAESYPNIRAWLNEDLFAHHTATFENTPFVWRLTTERLVSDAEGEGFGCLIDYHQLSSSTFDVLGRRYLEPRKSALRERRDAADERRRDQSIPAAERNEAEEEYRWCRSGIEQINALERALRDLRRHRPRDWSDEDRALAEQLKPQVARFRKRLEERLETLDRLWETATDDWLEDTFSPTFRERVQDNREEWIDALEDVETACEAYAQPADQPVEAHLYDLFVYYYDDLIGSTHYSSNGIYFLNYYFSKGEKYLAEDGTPRSGLAERERLLAELARETDADIELGEEIRASCEELADRIPSDWEERALSEVTTAGYRPVHKHGVRINIAPLAEADLVPELVERKVL
jgi:hypothetical protein